MEGPNQGNTLEIEQWEIFRYDPTDNFRIRPTYLPDNFPNKLYEMIEDAGRRGMKDVVSWQPHGKNQSMWSTGQCIFLRLLCFCN